MAPPTTTDSGAALRVLTSDTLWQHIVGFQGGPPTLLLQFQTQNYTKLLKQSRRWTQTLRGSCLWAYNRALVNVHWLALALLQNRFDVAQCILEYERQYPPAARGQPMLIGADAAHIVAVEGTVEQLQWLQDHGLLVELPHNLLSAVASSYMAYHWPKVHLRKMEDAMRWLVAHHPVACQRTMRSDDNYPHKLSLAMVIEFGKHLVPPPRVDAYVDWKNIGLDDLTALAREQPELIRSSRALQKEIIAGNDLQLLRFLLGVQDRQEASNCLWVAARIGDLEKVQLIRSYSGGGVDYAVIAAKNHGHEEIARFLCEHDGLAYDNMVAIHAEYYKLDRIIQERFKLPSMETGMSLGTLFIEAIRDNHELAYFLLEKLANDSVAKNDSGLTQWLVDACDIALLRAAECGDLAIFQAVHNAFHPHCCPKAGPSRALFLAMEEAPKSVFHSDCRLQNKRVTRIQLVAAAARGGNLELIRFFVGNCELARVSIDPTVISAAVAVADEDQSLRIVQYLLRVSELHLSTHTFHELLVCAAKRGHQRVIEFLLELADDSSLVCAALFKAASATRDEEKCLGILQLLISRLDRSASDLDLADTIACAAQRGFERVVDFLLTLGAPCSPATIANASRSANLALVKSLARRFPHHVSRLALDAAVHTDHDAVLMYLHDNHHEACCHPELLDEIAQSDKTRPVWSMVLHLYQHCPLRPKLTTHTKLQDFSTSHTAQRTIDLYGVDCLLRCARDSDSVQSTLASLSQMQRLHLTLLLQRGFPSLFTQVRDLPLSGQLPRVLSSINRGETTDEDIIQAHEGHGETQWLKRQQREKPHGHSH